jgi:hypothetical protein
VKLNQFLTLNALVFIAFGIAFALYGPLMIALFGVQKFAGENTGGLYWYSVSFARLFGAVLIGFGFLIWATSTLPDLAGEPLARRRLAFTLLLANAFALFVAVIQQITVWFEPSGWAAVAIFLFFTAGYIYYLAAPQPIPER